MENKIRKVAAMIFINENREILLQKRWSYAKRWEDVAFFWGGIEEWERHWDALIREMKEELNLDINLSECDYLWEFITEHPDDGLMNIRYVYLQKTTKKAEDFEVLEWEWAIFLSIDEARKLKFPTSVTKVLDFLEDNLLNHNLI